LQAFDISGLNPGRDYFWTNNPKIGDISLGKLSQGTGGMIPAWYHCDILG